MGVSGGLARGRRGGCASSTRSGSRLARWPMWPAVGRAPPCPGIRATKHPSRLYIWSTPCPVPPLYMVDTLPDTLPASIYGRHLARHLARGGCASSTRSGSRLARWPMWPAVGRAPPCPGIRATKHPSRLYIWSTPCPPLHMVDTLPLPDSPDSTYGRHLARHLARSPRYHGHAACNRSRRCSLSSAYAVDRVSCRLPT